MRNTRIALDDVLDGIRGQPGRAGLSVLAIAVGTVALTILLAALSGLREKAQHLIEELGVNAIAIVSENRGERAASGGTIDERRAALLAANLPSCLVSVMHCFAPLASDCSGILRIVAADANLKDARSWQLLRGRFLDGCDLRTFSRNAVITDDIATIPGWDIGQVVRIRDTPFTIVGVVAANTESLEMENIELSSLSGKGAVFVPLTTARQWLDASSPDSHNLDAVFIRAQEGSDLNDVQTVARRILSAPDVSCANCSWITPDRMLTGVSRMKSTILLTVGTMSLLCLVLGGTTLAGLMIANVRDRIPEIGLRRALGATRQDIASLFLLEGLLIAATGALLGVTVAHFFLLCTYAILPCPIKLGIVTLILPLVMSLLVGGLASYRPASTAANIAPADALRNE